MVPPSTIIALSAGKRSKTPPQSMKVSGRYSHHITSERSSPWRRANPRCGPSFGKSCRNTPVGRRARVKMDNHTQVFAGLPEGVVLAMCDRARVRPTGWDHHRAQAVLTHQRTASTACCTSHSSGMDATPICRAGSLAHTLPASGCGPWHRPTAAPAHASRGDSPRPAPNGWRVLFGNAVGKDDLGRDAITGQHAQALTRNPRRRSAPAR